MKQFTHIRLLATAALALSIGLVPLSARADNGGTSAAAAAPSTAASAAAGQASTSPETDGVIVTLTNTAERELQSLGDGRANGDISMLGSSSTFQELDQAGLDVAQQITTADGDIALEVQPEQGVSDQEALEDALELDSVESAQLNYVYNLIEPVIDEPLASAASTDAARAATSAGEVSTLAVDQMPNDPWAKNSNPDEDPNQYYLYSSHFVEAWNMAKADADVTVAVLDSGVMLNHDDLKANILTSLAWDSYYNKALTGDGDNVGHGTHVAGIIAATANNSIGIAGGSYNANILPVKVFSDDSSPRSNTTAIISAYQYIMTLVSSGAVDNLHVINMSLGYYGSDINDRLLEETIRTAREDYRIATVCAAGNGNKVDTAYTENIYPADFEECIAVTALTPTGSNVVFSDYNEAKDISAPGASIWSTYLRDTTIGNVKFGKYNRMTGTSMASPMVSAAAALMFAQNPDATVDQVCQALYATAEPVVDAENNRSELSGSHGALNVAAALVELQNIIDASQFPDVKPGDWFYDAVLDITRRGIMNGYDDGTGTFGPNNDLLREQAAAVFYNYLGKSDTSAPRAPHKDVLDDWYTVGVNWAYDKGYINGFSDEVFGVGQPLTREQLCCIFANILASEDEVENVDMTKFEAMPDADKTSSWARKSVAWCINKELINGVDVDGERQIQPDVNCSRGMMAALLSSAIKFGLI